MAYLLKVTILLNVACWKIDANYQLATRFEWKQIDFDFPYDHLRTEAIESGEFIPQNNVPLGIERWRNKLFVTLPRFERGVAATLTYIDLDTQEKSPKLKPYPNWEAHKLRENNGVPKIATVLRVNVDVCDRLWLADRGLIQAGRKKERLYDPRIQVYDLNTDRLVREYTLPKHVFKEDSYFANIIVDVSKNNCDWAFAYIADPGSNALVVYDLLRGESHRVTHPYFHFDPLHCDYNVGGVNWQWSLGVIGLALSPIQSDGFRTLYFHPMSSIHEFAVSTRIIRNKTIASNSYHEYKVLGSRGPNTQAIGSSLDEATGALFYTLFLKDSISCWNINNPEYSAVTNTILATDNVTMIFPNDLKVDKTGNLWVLTDRLQTFDFRKLNYSEVNFRIFVSPVEDIVRGTNCDKTSFSSRAMATNNRHYVHNFGDYYSTYLNPYAKQFVPTFYANDRQVK